MGQRFHGIISLSAVICALVIALSAVLNHSTIFGIVYASSIGICSAAIIFSYCAKCPCRFSGCGHVFPGLLARLLPFRQDSEYSKLDYLILIVAFLILIGFPQYWIWQNVTRGIIFWALLVVAFIEIRLCVCPECKNPGCPMCSYNQTPD